MKWKYVFIGIAALVAIPFTFTAINLLTAPARVANETLSTENIIFNYERFYDLNASYEARAGQISQFGEMYSSEENPAEKTKLRIELTAMQQSCREIVTKYNADSQKINREIFKANDLPVQLDIETCNL